MNLLQGHNVIINHRLSKSIACLKVIEFHAAKNKERHFKIKRYFDARNE